MQDTTSTHIIFPPLTASIELFDNAITGTLPSTLVLLSELQELVLNENQMTGNLPMALPSSLEILDLDFNQFGGELPNDVFVDLLQLQRIRIAGNQFAGRLPPNLGRLTQLTSLILHENAFTGDLENLNLQQQPIDGYVA
jgi:hypothetical protein